MHPQSYMLMGVHIFGEIKDEELNKEVTEKTEEITVHRKKKSKKAESGIKKSELKLYST